MSDECIFCKIVLGKAPASVVMESGDVMAFKSIDPVASTHILIIPKKHISTFTDLSPDSQEINYMTQTAQSLIKKLNIENGYKLVFNGGKYQAIPHVHWHLLGGEMKASALQET